MPEINIPSIELVSTIRTAPRNGSPSTNDYNDSEREKLADLSALAILINEQILPILNALPASAATGLDGANIYASRDQANALFYATEAQRFLTIAEVLINLYNRLSAGDTKIADIRAQVANLRARLATTDSNDIINSIQAFSEQVRQLTSASNALTQVADVHSTMFAAFRTVRVDTGDILQDEVVEVDVVFDPPMPNNNYTVSLMVESESASVRVLNFTKNPDGVGLTVRVHNESAVTASGTVHVSVRAD